MHRTCRPAAPTWAVQSVHPAFYTLTPVRLLVHRDAWSPWTRTLDQWGIVAISCCSVLPAYPPVDFPISDRLVYVASEEWYVFGQNRQHKNQPTLNTCKSLREVSVTVNWSLRRFLPSRWFGSDHWFGWPLLTLASISSWQIVLRARGVNACVSPLSSKLFINMSPRQIGGGFSRIPSSAWQVCTWPSSQMPTWLPD